VPARKLGKLRWIAGRGHHAISCVQRRETPLARIVVQMII
jgi:hypothetical protein